MTASSLRDRPAIARYLDTLPGPALTPQDPCAAARMAQVIALTDAFAAAPEGAGALARHAALSRWWAAMAAPASMAATDPGYGRARAGQDLTVPSAVPERRA